MNLTELRNLLLGTALVIVAALSFNIFLDQLEADTDLEQWYLLDFYTDHHQAAPPPLNQTIDAAGDTMTSNDIDQSITIYFPPNAVDKVTDVTFQYRLPYSAGTWRGLDRFFSLEAHQNGQPVTQFDPPVQITISFSDPSDPANQTAALYWFDNGEWRTSGITMINHTSSYITVQTNHFTEFALLADPEQVFLPIVVK